MCGCEEAHPGIFCHDAGCTCHKNSPTPWARTPQMGIYSVDMGEERASELADIFTDVIYFFATLDA